MSSVMNCSIDVFDFSEIGRHTGDTSIYFVDADTVFFSCISLARPSISTTTWCRTRMYQRSRAWEAADSEP